MEVYDAQNIEFSERHVCVQPTLLEGNEVQKCMERTDLMILNVQDVADQSTMEQSVCHQVDTWLSKGTTPARGSYLFRATKHIKGVQMNAASGHDMGQSDMIPDWILDT